MVCTLIFPKLPSRVSNVDVSRAKLTEIFNLNKNKALC